MSRRGDPPAGGTLAPDSPEREQARARLLLALVRFPAAAVPCHAGNVLSSYWTSDDPDEAAAAAAACRRCPALVPCVGFIVAYPDEAGVYGASTEASRRSRGRIGRDRCYGAVGYDTVTTHESTPADDDPLASPPTSSRPPGSPGGGAA